MAAAMARVLNYLKEVVLNHKHLIKSMFPTLILLHLLFDKTRFEGFDTLNLPFARLISTFQLTRPNEEKGRNVFSLSPTKRSTSIQSNLNFAFDQNAG